MGAEPINERTDLDVLDLRARASICSRLHRMLVISTLTGSSDEKSL